MRKFLKPAISLILCVIMCVTSLPMAIFAADVLDESTSLPVTFSQYGKKYGNDDYYNDLVLKRFYVTDVEFKSRTSSPSYLSVHYKLDATGESFYLDHAEFSLEVLWYDEYGKRINDDYYLISDSIDITKDGTREATLLAPGNAAFFKLIPEEVGYGDLTYEGEYVYKVKTVMYSPNGQSKLVYALQAPVYKEKGWSSVPYVKLYNLNNETISVKPEEVASYTSQGWYEYEATTVYNTSGETMVAPVAELASYEQKGWYAYPVTLMYAYGNTITVPTSEVDAYIATGWITYYNQTMYAPDGKAITVKADEIATYQSMGWYTIPVTYVYNTAGNAMVVGVAEVATYESVGWYRNIADVQATLYGLDGRTITVFTAQVPEYTAAGWYTAPVMYLYNTAGNSIVVYTYDAATYEAVGWSRNVEDVQTTLYNQDGDTITVFDAEVPAYTTVGWYTYNGYNYYRIESGCNSYLSKGDYNGAYEFVEVNEHLLAGTEYEYAVSTLKRTVLDKWNAKIKCPMAVLYSNAGSYYGTPTATIGFRNLSYKTIVAFKIKFTCYNVFGEVEKTYYDYYYDDNANIKPGDSYESWWKLYGADSVKSFSTIRVTEIVYADGTKWVR